MSGGAASPRLEAIVAFGARMSWAGLLRPGDAFPRSTRSQRAVLEATSGEPLRRVVGGWSVRHRRFTLNLGTPRVQARAIPAGGSMPAGVPCLLHWVDRSAFLGIGPGTVCAGDGWPIELWQRFLSRLEVASGGSIAEQLHRYLAEPGTTDGREAAAWRALVGTNAPDPRESERFLGTGWLPFAAPLEAAGDRSMCLLSWSPSIERFATFHEALASPTAGRLRPDARSQATYFVEATLARLHGVHATAPDALADPEYLRDPIVQEVLATLEPEERTRINDPRFGPLDRFGPDRPAQPS
jgi:hypothetical protein